jgi:preprotein translocase subunit SecF
LYDFVTNRKWFFLGSAVVILVSVISLGATGLNLGIEFSSGTTMTLVFKEPVDQESLRDNLSSLDHPEAIVQHSTKDAFLVDGLKLDSGGREQLADNLQSEYDTTLRLAEFRGEGNITTVVLLFGKSLDEGDLNGRLTDLGYTEFTLESRELDSFLVRTDTLYPDDEKLILEALSVYGPVDSLDVYSISPDIASERVDLTMYAVIAATAGILLYVTWAFRRLASSFRYGVCAIIALVHDALVVLGVFSLFRLEVDSVFIIAVLFVIGYSVNNTIVIFDRIRENRTRDFSINFDLIVNMSLTGTLGRSLNTSLTTLFVLVALYLFGGATISNFVLALIIGVVAGTYSSLFIASQLLVSWERGELGRLVRWIPLPSRLRRE